MKINYLNEEELHLHIHQVRVWLNHCATLFHLNILLKHGKTGLHKEYKFEEFISETINNSKMDNEPLVNYWARLKNIV